MGFSVQQIDNRLTAIVCDEFGREMRIDISPLLTLGPDIDKFFKPIIDILRLQRMKTQLTQFAKLRAFGEALSSIGIKCLPKDEAGWQELVLGVHRFIITRTDKKASLQTRVSSTWLSIRGFLIHLIDAGVAPVSLYLPPVRENLALIDISAHHERLLGHRAPTIIEGKDNIDKLLCPVSWSRTDAEYLEELRNSLAARRHHLYEVLLDHWKKIKANFEYGRQLRESVNWDELKPIVEQYPMRKAANHPANPRSGIQGLANYLAVIQHMYDGRPLSDDDFRNLKLDHECLPRLNVIGPISIWATLNHAPDAHFECSDWSEKNVLWWWLGRISHFDASMIAALLIMLHPSWTPQSILFSKISNRHGKLYLDLSDKGQTYEIDKPRAKAMKMESVDPLAYEIISTLIQEGAEIREKLKKNNDSKASLLFLPYGRNNVVAPIETMASTYLSGSSIGKANGILWIGSLYPQLATVGLGKGTINLIKIRNTEGVLEWFRTKSLRLVAKKLGNTEKVVLQHYIPRAILDAWNTRMIRRFQNLWISTAAANEDFLLDVTDFSSLADLHAFLKDILQLHASTESPLAEILHQRFNILLPEDKRNSTSSTADKSAHLHVAISTAALSTLYSYHDALIQQGLSESMLNKPDIVTGFTPRHFLDLTDLLQARLPHDKNPEYVACHEAAIAAASDPSNRRKWSQLLTD